MHLPERVTLCSHAAPATVLHRHLGSGNAPTPCTKLLYRRRLIGWEALEYGESGCTSWVQLALGLTNSIFSAAAWRQSRICLLLAAGLRLRVRCSTPGDGIEATTMSIRRGSRPAAATAIHRATSNFYPALREAAYWALSEDHAAAAGEAGIVA